MKCLRTSLFYRPHAIFEYCKLLVHYVQIYIEILYALSLWPLKSNKTQRKQTVSTADPCCCFVHYISRFSGSQGAKEADEACCVESTEIFHCGGIHPHSCCAQHLPFLFMLVCVHGVNVDVFSPCSPGPPWFHWGISIGSPKNSHFYFRHHKQSINCYSGGQVLKQTLEEKCCDWETSTEIMHNVMAAANVHFSTLHLST